MKYTFHYAAASPLAAVTPHWYIYPWACAQRQIGSADPPEKMAKKLKSENMQKRAVFYVYVIFSEQSGQADVENGAMLTTLFIQIYFRMHQFVVKFSKFSSPRGGKGALTP